MDVVILAGGCGTRICEESQYKLMAHSQVNGHNFYVLL